MSSIALNVLPIFLLILIGWALVRTRLLKASVGDGLGDFVFRVAVPVLLFRTIAEANFQGQSPWSLWVAYFSGVAVTWTMGHFAVTRLFGQDGRIGVLAGVSSAFANNVFIGLPLVSRIVGDQGVVALSILLSVHLPVMMIAGTLLMERAERIAGGAEAQPIGKVLRTVGHNLVTNPLVVGLVLGALFHLGGMPLSGPIKVVVDQIAGIAGPAALISLGMALNKYGLSDGVRPALVTSTFKLVLLPATVFAASHLLGLSPNWTAALVLTSAVPTGVNAWLIANHFGVGHGLASSTITLTTAVGVVTVSAWAWLLGT
ncbi:AEC family transporter [Oryzibacter oryziterrae]|uniref:AEC family transporter n=1 Tax=Oryzibacter oryziterrae TaxID=2766474 RepID=UPI001F372C3F|nr:AEC family transporter [Oryzibacter oryziterrae]